MNSEEAASIAQSAGVKQLVLSHLPQFGVLEQLKEEAKQIYTGEIVLAGEGYVWEQYLGRSFDLQWFMR